MVSLVNYMATILTTFMSRLYYRQANHTNYLMCIAILLVVYIITIALIYVHYCVDTNSDTTNDNGVD